MAGNASVAPADSCWLAAASKAAARLAHGAVALAGVDLEGAREHGVERGVQGDADLAGAERGDGAAAEELLLPGVEIGGLPLAGAPEGAAGERVEGEQGRGEDVGRGAGLLALLHLLGGEPGCAQGVSVVSGDREADEPGAEVGEASLEVGRAAQEHVRGLEGVVGDLADVGGVQTARQRLEHARHLRGGERAARDDLRDGGELHERRRAEGRARGGVVAGLQHVDDHVAGELHRLGVDALHRLGDVRPLAHGGVVHLHHRLAARGGERAERRGRSAVRDEGLDAEVVRSAGEDGPRREVRGCH